MERSGRTRARLYSWAMIPTRSVRKALAVPDVTEFTKTALATCSPGTADAAEPRTLDRTGWIASESSASSSSVARKVVPRTLA